MPEIIVCPSCNQKLHVKGKFPSRITCPKCLRVLANPHARIPPAIEPKDVLPVEQDVENDQTGTIRALGIAAIVLVVGAILAAMRGGMESVLGPLLVFAVVLITIASGFKSLSIKTFEVETEDLPEQAKPVASISPSKGSENVLDYGQKRYVYKARERKVSIGAFFLGFFAAIGLGALAFFGLAITSDDSSVSIGARRMIFGLVIASIAGLIIGAAHVSRRSAYAGFGRGVAVGLILAMVALAPCGYCYLIYALK